MGWAGAVPGPSPSSHPPSTLLLDLHALQRGIVGLHAGRQRGRAGLGARARREQVRVPAGGRRRRPGEMKQEGGLTAAGDVGWARHRQRCPLLIPLPLFSFTCRPAPRSGSPSCRRRTGAERPRRRRRRGRRRRQCRRAASRRRRRSVCAGGHSPLAARPPRAAPLDAAPAQRPARAHGGRRAAAAAAAAHRRRRATALRRPATVPIHIIWVRFCRGGRVGRGRGRARRT